MTDQNTTEEKINKDRNTVLTLQTTHLQLESELSILENQRFLTADEEQKIISNFLEKKIEQIDLITELLKVFGDVLNDYKLSLIEEVVFGKKTIK